MSRPERDIRFGHDYTRVQDSSGVDLLQLEKQLTLTVGERFEALERQLEFLKGLRGTAVR